jgi:hypothetical protein
MGFRALDAAKRQHLLTALRANATSDRTILMDRQDTSFVGSTEEISVEEVILAIRGVPCHY